MRWALLLALACAARAQEIRPPPREYLQELQKGIDLHNARKYDEALTVFARARAMAPHDWQGHTWQAFTLLQQAMRETGDKRRRIALTEEADSMADVLASQSGLLFQHPLRHYILGLAASVRGEERRALVHFTRAHAAHPSMFGAFESIRLREAVQRAYARGLIDYAKRFVLQGMFDKADPLLHRAETLLREDDVGGRRDLERSRAVVDEALGRYDSAIARLRKCIKLNPDDRELQIEFVGTIAQIYFKTQRYEEGAKALAEAPKDTRHPEILAARCTLLLHPALKAMPKDPQVDQALAYFIEAMAMYPPEDVYRLVEDYALVVLHKVGRREAKKERALLEDTVKRLLVEVERRPECPSLYHLLYKLYKLLGDKQNEIKYQNLHTTRKKEWEGKARFDARGRPRCK